MKSSMTLTGALQDMGVRSPPYSLITALCTARIAVVSQRCVALMEGNGELEVGDGDGLRFWVET